MSLKNIPKMDQHFRCDDEKINLWKDNLNLSKNKKYRHCNIRNPNQIFENRRKIDLEYFCL